MIGKLLQEFCPPPAESFLLFCEKVVLTLQEVRAVCLDTRVKLASWFIGPHIKNIPVHVSELAGKATMTSAVHGADHT